MKKFLLLGLMLLGLGGIISVKAEKLSLSFKTEFYCAASWSSSTNTFTWGLGGNNSAWTFMAVQNLSGDLSEYTKLHLKLTEFSNSVDNKLTLYFKENKGNTQSMDYVTAVNLVPDNNGVVEIDLTTFDWKNQKTPTETIDKTNIFDVTIYGGARTNDSENGSVKVTDAYLEKPDAPFVTEKLMLGEEITDFNYILGGGKFVIANTDGTRVQTYVSDEAGASSTSLSEVSTNQYYYLKAGVAPALDVDGDGNNDDPTYFNISVYNVDGNAKPSNWWGANYICRIGWGDLWTTNFSENLDGEGKPTTNHYGRDNAYSAVWTIDYVSGSGFNYPANDQIFAFSNATGYDSETGIGNNMGWSFDTPVDLSNWKYLVIGLANTAANGSHKITIKDNTGKSVGGDDYNGEEAKTGAGMWFDYWNSQNIIAVSTEQLSIANGLDIHNITSLSIAGEVKPTVAYLTSYANTKLVNRGRWTLYVDGDLKREYTTETLGKFGTICLPYKASYAGAEIYSIASANSSSITLSKVTGLLEAGKPYFYLAVDEVGQDNGNAGKNVHNVNFFRADFDRYDVATPSTNNGLIGTFVDGTVPQGPNYYVVGRAAGDTEDKIFQVDSEVSLPANRAYIDKSMIADIAVSSRTLLLGFDGEENEATAIESTEVVDVVTNAVFYDMSGREVKTLTPGIYIVKYGNLTKKVMIK